MRYYCDEESVERWAGKDYLNAIFIDSQVLLTCTFDVLLARTITRLISTVVHYFVKRYKPKRTCTIGLQLASKAKYRRHNIYIMHHDVWYKILDGVIDTICSKRAQIN